MKNLKGLMQEEPLQREWMDTYHEASSYTRHNAAERFGQISDFFTAQEGQETFIETRYPHKPEVVLPGIREPGVFARLRCSLFQLLRARRSRRIFPERVLSLSDISTLLQMSYGRREGGQGFTFSTIPSGGGLFPLQIYLVSLRAALPEGIYHYFYAQPVLRELVRREGLEEELKRVIFTTNFEGSPGMFCVITSRMSRVIEKYGERAYRFSYLEAGHLAQNLLLVGESLGLAMCPLGGFFDRELAALLGLDWVEEKPLYVVALG